MPNVAIATTQLLDIFGKSGNVSESTPKIVRLLSRRIVGNQPHCAPFGCMMQLRCSYAGCGRPTITRGARPREVENEAVREELPGRHAVGLVYLCCWKEVDKREG